MEVGITKNVFFVVSSRIYLYHFCLLQFDKENVIDNWTPLAVACFHGKVRATKALLNMRADIFRRNKQTQESVLHHALKSELSNNVYVDKSDFYIFFILSKGDNSDVVQLLLDELEKIQDDSKGEDLKVTSVITAGDKYGVTPLML